MENPLLILNAAEGQLDVIVCLNGEIEASFSLKAASQGAERLVPLLDSVLKALSLSPQSISHIACVLGPGSFTGLRLCLTSAAALRRTSKHEGGAKVYGINYLHAIAASQFALPKNTHLRVLTHARRGLVYAQDFMCNQESTDKDLQVPEILSDIFVLPIKEALEMSCKGQKPEYLVGSGVTNNQVAVQEFLNEERNIRILPESCNLPQARALFALCPNLYESSWQSKDLEPLYLRPCDAEENLAHIAKKDGRSPEEAKKTLDKLLKKEIRG